MSATEIVTVGRSLPRLRSVEARQGDAVSVTWDAASRGGMTEVVDLAPLMFRLKFYAPLRDDQALRDSVHLIDDGTALAWGDDTVDMAATSVLDLAEESMETADFAAFMRRHSFTLDRVAAELGISSRLAAHYAQGAVFPRYIALACRQIDGAREAA